MTIPPFIVPVLVGVISHLSKRLFNQAKYSDIKNQGMPIPRYGGMPSAHAAFAASLATTVAMVESIYSGAFATSIIAYIFIVDDALRMRVFVGLHGDAIRALITKLPQDEQVKYPHVEPHLGHTWPEVVVGTIIGIIATVIIITITT